MRWTTALGWLVMALLIPVAGCSGSSRPDTAPVTGLVTYKGEPVAEAQVSFIPAQGRPASGATGADGRFELSTFEAGDGALLGDHTVTVMKMAPAPGEEDDMYAEQLSLIPEKYANLQTSPLKATVTATGPNEFEFDLTE